MLRKSPNLFSANYEHVLILRNFNVEFNHACINAFYDSYSLQSLVKEPSCFKNLENRSCIDSMLTNCPNSYQNL